MLDHHAYELLEVHFWLPAKLGFRLRWVSDEQVNFCRT
jgi:hypothetical protein